MELKRVVIVGSGNVAEALARALPASGVELCQLFARKLQLIHLPVSSLGRQQLLVSALLHGLPTMKHQNGVGINNSR